MKYNTATYRCPKTQMVIGYSTPSTLPDTLVRGNLTLIKE
tara:strand:- start:99 stop:218 length:120 start_codon:yes stop_codon:yes gene_type:complete